jgi:hypothetical protein
MAAIAFAESKRHDGSSGGEAVSHVSDDVALSMIDDEVERVTA